MANPIIPPPGVAAASIRNDADGDEELVNNEQLDEGESTDDQDTVEEDVREAKSVNEKLDE